MKYINIIKIKGWKYFWRAIVAEIQKRWFITWNRVVYRGENYTTYSQYAEDLYIDRILGYKQRGVYIDIGANHPDQLSNTKKFYLRGWRGVNVEPNVGSIEAFRKYRPQDINLNVGVGSKSGSLDFYMFDHLTLSTFLPKVAGHLEHEGYKLERKVKVPVLTLNEIYDSYISSEVDFISIDTEGYNWEVLKGNDWSKNCPKLICIEEEEGGEYDSFFTGYGYRKISHNGLNAFFIRNG